MLFIIIIIPTNYWLIDKIILLGFLNQIKKFFAKYIPGSGANPNGNLETKSIEWWLNQINEETR